MVASGQRHTSAAPCRSQSSDRKVGGKRVVHSALCRNTRPVSEATVRLT